MMPAGRRPLRSTLFLVTALRELPPDEPPRALYPVWRDLHRRTCGYELYDAKRSFRAAAARENGRRGGRPRKTQ